MLRRCSPPLASLVALLTALGVASAASAKPLSHVSTGRDVCHHRTATTWKIAYESFGSVAYRNLDGSTAHQRAPGGGRPESGLRTALQQTADVFGKQSGCTVGLRFDVYWAPNATAHLRQEPYYRLLASDLPLPTPVPGGPRRERDFFGRYDTVMEQFSAVDGSGRTLLGPGFEGETYGYVSLIDSTAPHSSVLTYELLQGMSRFFVTRGGRIAPNPYTYMDAYCSALQKLGYTDLVRNTSQTCTSDRYALDMIAGRVPIYHGITRRLWRRYSVSRSYRRHHTLPAGLPAGHGAITNGAGPH